VPRRDCSTRRLVDRHICRVRQRCLCLLLALKSRRSVLAQDAKEEYFDLYAPMV
jgi:hypothetical protein